VDFHDTHLTDASAYKPRDLLECLLASTVTISETRGLQRPPPPPPRPAPKPYACGGHSGLLCPASKLLSFLDKT